MLKKILGNALEDSGNVTKDSGEYSGRFRGMDEKISGDVRENSGEFSSRFRRMLSKNLGNV